MKNSIGYAQMGAWDALGEDKQSLRTNELNKMYMQNQFEIEKENRAAARAAAQAQQKALDDIAPNPVNIYSSKEKTADHDNVKNFSHYFFRDENGKMKMTQQGLDEYNRKIPEDVRSVGLGALAIGQATGDSPFKKLIDSLGGAKYFRNGKVSQPGNLGNLWAQYVRDTEEGKRYDATRSTEFVYTPTSEEQKLWKNAIIKGRRGFSNLEEVDFDAKENKFKITGNTLDLDNLASDDYTVLDTRFSPYGSTAIIQNKDGETHRYKLPNGVNPTNENLRDELMQRALNIQNIMLTGKTPDGRTLTTAQLAELQNDYKIFLKRAHRAHGQLVLTTKANNQEVKPLDF
jgi:hypothetical protein